MQVRKLFYNRRTPTIALPQDAIQAAGATRGDYFAVTVDQAKRIILTKLSNPPAPPKTAAGKPRRPRS